MVTIDFLGKKTPRYPILDIFIFVQIYKPTSFLFQILYWDWNLIIIINKKVITIIELIKIGKKRDEIE